MSNYVANEVRIAADKATWEALKEFVKSEEREFDFWNVINAYGNTYHETWTSSSNANYAWLKNRTYHFETVWAEPEKVMIALAEKFPMAKITHKFASDDYGCGCGVRVYENGTLVSDTPRDRKFAQRMWRD